MKRILKCSKCMKLALCKIHLVDKCLIIFMMILLLQSAFSLFFYGGTESEAGGIDVIVRTSSAAIFGYFLSANFIRHSANSGNKSVSAISSAVIANKSSSQKETVKNEIGFKPPVKVDSGNIKSEKQDIEEQLEIGTASRLQIIAATSIGVFCLITLLMIRNISLFYPDVQWFVPNTAIISQFRDFISGCVGFLIGCPTSDPSTK